MANFHNVTISVFCRQDEDIGLIKERIEGLLALNLVQEKLVIEESHAAGFENKDITIFRLHMEKKRHVNAFVNIILGRLSKEQKELIVRQAPTRIDDDSTFYLRFDKGRLLSENELELTDSGNCFHIKMHVAAYPNNYENALKAVRETFES